MPNRFDFGGVHVSAGEDTSSTRPSSEIPFCVALVGDFSGRTNRGVVESKTIGERHVLLVDRDNFDEVLASLAPQLRLSRENTPYVFHFSKLDDFHPDRLFEHESFSRLRGLRTRLQDPSAFEEFLKELGLPANDLVADQHPEPSPSTPSVASLARGSLLEQTIERTESRLSAEPSAEDRDPMRKFAQQLAAKYSVRRLDPRQPELIAALDHALADAMRAVLHHPDFQALEASWQAAFCLVRELDTGSRLKLCLIDISKEELAADFNSASDFQDACFFRLMVEKTVQAYGADPWALIVGNYRFGPDSDDAKLLSVLAKTAHCASSPFIAEASPRLLGLGSLSQAEWSLEPSRPREAGDWTALRCLPEADSVALAIPRYLLRLPYGKKTAPIDSFNFEEFPGAPLHEDYLWGNPAFAVALLLCRTFAEAGWDMRPGQDAQITGLPLHVYGEGTNSEAKPCGEVLFTQDAVEQVLEAGLMPLVSYKGRDSIRVARFQSISQPSRPLAGRWAISGTKS